MAIGVVQIDLPITIGPLLQLGSDRYALRAGNLRRSSNIGHRESNVVPSGHDRCAAISPAGLPRFRIGLRRMDLNVADLKPQPGKAKRGAWNFRHPQQPDIEVARGVEIRADQSDMIKPGDVYRRRSFHAPIMPKAGRRGEVTRAGN